MSDSFRSSSRASGPAPPAATPGPRSLPPLVLLLICLVTALAVAGCGGKKVGDTAKYRADQEEMMSGYTPRDDGLPLTSDELYAFKTVSDLDRELSEEDARIVELHFKFFVHQHRKTFERFLERSSRFLPYIQKTFADRGIPADIAYLCMVESGGNPNARSPAGAAGLWQFMPFTGRKFGLAQNAWVDERRDPYKSTYAASDYLLKLYSDFSNWHLAVAAYNAGEGKIGRAVSGTGATDFFELCRLDDQLEEKARLKTETRDYVPRLIAVAKIMRNLKRLGFTPPSPGAAWNLSAFTVPPGVNLSGLASHLRLSWDEFSGMNPAYRRTSSPPMASSTAYVPPEQLTSAQSWVNQAQAKAKASTGWREHTIRKGDTLASLARRYQVSAKSICDANGFERLPGRGVCILIPIRESAGTAASAPGGKGGASAAGKAGRADSASSHTVRPGDTVYGIARSYGISAKELCEANNLSLSRPVIKPGMRLVVPGRAGSAGQARSAAPAKAVEARADSGKDARSSGGTVTVKAGDTLAGIARNNNVSVSALQKANKMGKKTTLSIGQKLVLP